MTDDADSALDDRAVADLGDRDPDAIAATYEALADPLFRYVRSRCGDEELAADIVGATFVELVQTAPRLEGGVSGLRRWLFTAARHNLLDEQRKRRRRGDVALDDDGDSGVAPVGRAADSTAQLANGELAQPAHGEQALTPEEQVTAAERDQEVREALTTLADDQREVLELRFAGELSAKEIGAVMGRSPGAVRVLQHRALKALSRALGQRHPDARAHVTAEVGDAAGHSFASLPRGPPGDRS